MDEGEIKQWREAALSNPLWANGEKIPDCLWHWKGVGVARPLKRLLLFCILHWTPERDPLGLHWQVSVSITDTNSTLRLNNAQVRDAIAQADKLLFGIGQGEFKVVKTSGGKIVSVLKKCTAQEESTARFRRPQP